MIRRAACHGNKPLDFVAALVEADFQASNIFRITRELGYLKGIRRR